MTETLSIIVTAAKNTPTMGFFRDPRKVLRAHVEVLEAFNSNGTDLLVVGHADNDDGYIASIDVSTTGVKTVTLGSDIAYDSTPRAVIAKYTASGSAPTTGKVVITIEYVRLPS